MSVKKITLNPNTLDELNNYLDSIDFLPEVLLQAPNLLFSPELGKEDWISQLQILKKHGAKVGGLSFNEFEDVDVVNLESIPDDLIISTLSKRKPRLLIVAYGACHRDFHLAISKGITVIGSNSIIEVSNKEINLNIPSSIISCNRKHTNNYEDSNWLIYSQEDGDLFNAE